jgi:NUMOD3 motif
MKQFYSYLWLRADSTPYYAGKGIGNRAFQSRGHSVQCPADRTRILIFFHSTEAEAFESEKAFIKWFGRKDLGTGCLRNWTNGGEGTSGRVWSLESRQKVGMRTRGVISPRRGQKLSLVTRQKMREAQRGNQKSLGHKNALGYHWSAEIKARMAEAHKGQNNRLGAHVTEETKIKMRVAQQARRAKEKQS